MLATQKRPKISREGLKKVAERIRGMIPAKRDRKRLPERATIVYRKADGTVCIRYHETDIITVLPDNKIVLDSGGYHTVTTKSRINEHMTPLVYISQRNFQWFLSIHDVATIPWEDGIVLGDPLPKANTKATVRAEKLRKRIDAYCNGYIEKLREAKMDSPSAGDCMICRLCAQNPDHRDSGHLESHMRAKYYVPNLIVAAFESMGASDMMRAVVQSKCQQFKGAPPEKWLDDLNMWPEITKMLRRYMYGQLGLAG